MMPVDRLFVTGTDTGIGKSVASAALLHALRRDGRSAVGMKPVASGCEQVEGQWRNEDALLLQSASVPQPGYADVNPFALPEPLAPELAAAGAGVSLSLAPVQTAFARLQARADRVVVEGVGGWLAPLSASLDQVDVVRALDLSVVLVVGLRLGCINHARLTHQAIEASGARLVGWIANDVDPTMACADENFAILHRYLKVPCWGRLPHAAKPDPAVMARHLTIPR